MRRPCETKRDNWASPLCLPVMYEKLGRRAGAAAEFKKLQAAMSDDGPYQYATIHAQSGDYSKALEWLNRAMRTRDPGLIYLRTEPPFDLLLHEPRFQVVIRELQFPD